MNLIIIKSDKTLISWKIFPKKPFQLNFISEFLVSTHLFRSSSNEFFSIKEKKTHLILFNSLIKIKRMSFSFTKQNSINDSYLLHFSIFNKFISFSFHIHITAEKENSNNKRDLFKISLTEFFKYFSRGDFHTD
jgi:hypothetical protein